MTPKILHDAPNLRHLTAALEIQRLGSINRAADSIHLTQSALTQAIKKLEHMLGFSLFERAATGLFPTEEGNIYLRRVARAFDQLYAIDKLVQQRDAKKSPVHRQITTAQLRAFLHVVEQGSYTLAAHRLALSQPTIHRAVKDFEVICGQTFFQRSPGGVEPGWQAKLIARHINLFFSELNQGLEEVDEHRGFLRGSLRIGSLPLSRTKMVPDAVLKLLAEFPDAGVSIIDGPYEELLHSLLSGRLDLIVGALREPPPSPEIVQELLFHDPLHLVFRPGHKLATQPKISANALRKLDWVAPREHAPAREAFSRFFTSRGLEPPDRVIECSSLVAIRAILLNSDRVALLPARQVQVEVELGLLMVSPQSLLGTSRKIGLSYRRNYIPTRVQQRFIELIKTS